MNITNGPTIYSNAVRCAVEIVTSACPVQPNIRHGGKFIPINPHEGGVTGALVFGLAKRSAET
ncbi:hypothetical protein [Bradyrhizobium diazoefficiens]|uniref:hypothetical protein n=1 Tax=Bradyrhizobium diazoefficiens TaxID=1355477 RepID=UPI00272BDF48|nr:hypothetical protein [Bradyrhizobium diazoefficiens]WLA68391.1 hypothetical protein QNN01_18015 [Bradyrhizobium diazoefficiens]